MSYEDKNAVVFKFPSHDFGAGAGATSFKLPKGRKGRLIDIGVMDITEAFTAVSTPAYVRVGTSGDADAYGELNCGTAALTDTRNSVDDTDAVINQNLPADTQIEVTFVAPTGGTPAGIACAFVVVELI